ncbi:MAG: LysM peptidoglycan-binding domain-containing protein [Bacteroidota bacterium]|nr:LysM peptidoglycan-binding domain-containing protein [Bacteroidota bacterium]
MKCKPILFPVVLCSVCCFFAIGSFAQADYVVHKIQKGETLSALARKFGTSVGEIMRLNKMNSKSILRIGEAVKIPSKTKASKKTRQEVSPVVSNTPDAPVIAKQSEINTTSSVPYQVHVVGAKETLYGISRKYKVTVDQLKQWNHLTSNNIHAGQKLHIGTQAAENTTVITPVQQEPAVTTASSEKVPAQNTTVTTPSATTNTTTVPTTQASAPATTSTPTKPVVAEETTSNEDYSKVSIEGYFAAQYRKGREEMNGDAATFKTASGWTDKKYYVLINNIPSNTIIRVASNGKFVYAKVLGPLPNIKEDDGLLLRISNAAASALGIVDYKFPVIINY